MKVPFFEDNLTRLARKMKQGDQGAAEALYDELAGKVFGFCLNRTSNRVSAEDLAQEIFLKLVNKIETFDEKRGNFSVWFWQIARNTLTDYYREKKEAFFSDFPEEKIEESALHEPGQSVEGKMEVERLNSFLGTLGEEEQRLFEMRYIAELSYKEISEILEKSEGALRVGMSRLKQKIRKNFIS